MSDATSIPSPTHARSHLATLSRNGGTPEDKDAARRTLATANVAAAIRKNLAAAPPLTVEQRGLLAGLLFADGAEQ